MNQLSLLTENWLPNCSFRAGGKETDEVRKSFEYFLTQIYFRRTKVEQRATPSSIVQRKLK